MHLLEIRAKASKKGITLFFRGDANSPVISGCFGPRSGDYTMRLVEDDNWDKVKERLVDWIGRYPDVDISEIWV